MTRDPLDDFRALNDPTCRREVERRGEYFVVEGIVAIQRLLTLPDWTIRTLALLPKVADRLGERLQGTDAEVVVTDRATLADIVGFDIHRGALASVERRAPRPADELIPTTGLLLAAEGVNDHENLGSLYRNAAAFSADAVLLDPTCADPFYRRSIRVSLGHVLALPTGVLAPLPAGLTDLHDRGVTTIALTPTAKSSIRDLDVTSFGPGPVALLVGAEGPGLAEATLAAATHCVAIPMAQGVDSLNVATAAAVALHHLSPVQ